jgi:hypothetical protein
MTTDQSANGAVLPIEQAILHLLRQMQDLLNPPAGPEPPKKEIGFQVKESKGRYVVRRKTE